MQSRNAPIRSPYFFPVPGVISISASAVFKCMGKVWVRFNGLPRERTQNVLVGSRTRFPHGRCLHRIGMVVSSIRIRRLLDEMADEGSGLQMRLIPLSCQRLASKYMTASANLRGVIAEKESKVVVLRSGPLLN